MSPPKVSFEFMFNMTLIAFGGILLEVHFCVGFISETAGAAIKY